MDPFSYICVLTSIVSGLAVTRLVGGLGQLLQTRHRTPTYWVHTIWMVNTLIAVLIMWWVQYRWRNTQHWTLFLVLWLLIAPMAFYLASALLFPNEQEGEPITDWHRHYFATHRGFFLLMALTFVIDVVDTLLKGIEHFRSLGPAYPASMALLCTLCAMAAFSKSKMFHGIFAAFFLIWNLSMLGSNLLRLM